MKIWDALVRWWSPEPLLRIEALDLSGLSVRAEPGTYNLQIPVGRLLPLEGGELGKGDAPAYAVSGTPRHIPWHIRRRELEAQHKTKRRQRDQFREEA